MKEKYEQVKITLSNDGFLYYFKPIEQFTISKNEEEVGLRHKSKSWVMLDRKDVFKVDR